MKCCCLALMAITCMGPAFASEGWAESAASQSSPSSGPQQSPSPVTRKPQAAADQTEGPPVRKSPLAPYAGTWAADFEGKPFLVVKLALKGDGLTGWVQHPHSVELYDNGDLKSASSDNSAGVLQDAKLTGDAVLLTVKDETTNEVDRFSMQLTGESTANIRMLAMSMPPGMAKPKPWKLTKVTGATAAQHR